MVKSFFRTGICLLVPAFVIGCGNISYALKTFRGIDGSNPCREKDSTRICIGLKETYKMGFMAGSYSHPYLLEISVSSSNNRMKDKAVVFRSVRVVFEGGNEYELFKKSDHDFPYILMPAWRDDIFQTRATFDLSKAMPEYRKGMRFKVVSILKLPDGKDFETVEKWFESYEESREVPFWADFWSR